MDHIYKLKGVKETKVYIAVDFDGTCTTHCWPKIGKNIGSVAWLKKWMNAGASLILYTMRSGDHLQDAVKWFTQHDLWLYGINVNPDQAEWTDSPKVYAHIYVDDSAFGCPLIYPPSGERPYVDWSKVGPHVLQIIQTSKEITE